MEQTSAESGAQLSLFRVEWRPVACFNPAVHDIPRIGFLTAALIAAWATCGHAGEHQLIRTGSVRVTGNEKVKSAIITREIPLRLGDPFDYDRLEKGRANLRFVPGVDYSEIRVQYEPEDSTMGLRVIVTERRTLGGNIWIQRNDENTFSLGMKLYDDGFRGCGERLALSAVVFGNTALRTRWENPWLGSGARIGVGANAFYRRYRYTYDDAGAAAHDARIRRGGGEVSLFHEFDRTRSRVYLELGYESVAGDSVMTLAPGGDNYGLVTVGVRLDRRGHPQFPFSGYALALEGSAIGPGTDNILEAHVDLRAFHTLVGNLVIGAHSVFAAASGDAVPVYRRQHVGGPQTLRGYDFGEFNGTRSWVGGAELRLPVNFNRKYGLDDVLAGIEIHAFTDFGNAWEKNAPIALDDVRGGYGVGLAVLNRQVRGVRFDAGWHDRSKPRYNLEFGLKF